jgi:hypothetical protein
MRGRSVPNRLWRHAADPEPLRLEAAILSRIRSPVTSRRDSAIYLIGLQSKPVERLGAELLFAQATAAAGSSALVRAAIS